MKFAWLTDIHINFLEQEARQAFYQDILRSPCDGVIISGDIAEAPSVAPLLKEMANHIQLPIYFVLGNHDFYRHEVASVKETMTKLTATENLLFWLPAAGPQQLLNRTLLIGQDGWADGRFGNYNESHVRLRDCQLIPDLREQDKLGKQALLAKMQEFADADAEQLQQQIEQGTQLHQPEKIIVVTHVPPFREACLYQGRISGDDYLPYFGSKATGDVLLAAAQKHPDTQFLVLCGHTHDPATIQPLANLTVKAGKAEYLHPEVQSYLEVSSQ